MLEKQNLVFQHISDLYCYLLNVSGGIPYGIHKWRKPTSKHSSYQNGALLPILQAFSSNVLNDVLDNLGILKEHNF